MAQIIPLKKHQRLAAWCDRWLTAWSSSCAEQVLGFYTDDCMVVDPLLPQAIVGRLALTQALDDLLAQYRQWRFIRQRCTRSGWCVTVTWIMHLPGDVATVGTPGTSHLILRGERIVQQECWFDQHPLEPALSRAARLSRRPAARRRA